VCYRGCDGRVAITNISSHGAIGSHQGFGVNNRHHIYCLWILTVFASLDDMSSSHDSVMSITLTVPEDHLKTACLKVFIVMLLLLVVFSLT